MAFRHGQKIFILGISICLTALAHHNNFAKREILSSEDFWTSVCFGLLATVFISIIPFAILFLIPVKEANDEKQRSLLKLLLSFAAGSLLGDAFLHLIPHSISLEFSLPVHHNHRDHKHEHGHHHHGHHARTGFFVLLGILCFLFVEKLVRHLNVGCSHHKKHTQHVHFKDSDVDNSSEASESICSSDQELRNRKKDIDQNEHKINKNLKCSKDEEFNVAGYLNLAADFCHNLTDGLALGASFLAGNTVGLLTMFSIFLHEIPHEISDYALLIQSGVKPINAILLQLVTGLGAVLGCIFAVSFGGNFAIHYIIPFTAGGFIYIATVLIMPDLLENKACSTGQACKQIFSMISGVFVMAVMVYIE